MDPVVDDKSNSSVKVPNHPCPGVSVQSDYDVVRDVFAANRNWLDNGWARRPGPVPAGIRAGNTTAAGSQSDYRRVRGGKKGDEWHPGETKATATTTTTMRIRDMESWRWAWRS